MKLTELAALLLPPKRWVAPSKGGYSAVGKNPDPLPPPPPGRGSPSR